MSRLPSLLLLLSVAGCGLWRSPAPPDLATHGDLEAPVDMRSSAADLPMLVDGPLRDIGANCGGGFLNSDASDSCPLLCSADVTPVADEGRTHTNWCTPVSYAANPPASGTHWPAPDAWGFHQQVVPREWWVHNLEHGGVVLLWNCPSSGGKDPSPPLCNDAGTGEYAPADQGCPTEIAQMRQLLAQRQPDLFNETRILITSDPLLPKRFAAVAWDWTYLSDTFDAGAVECFINARYGLGPELAP